NMVDWAISRDRYWGTPLPIWVCKCGNQECLGSIEELKKRGINVPANIEPHKPYVDEIELQCEKCKGMMKRVPEVIDCWFDSGVMHTAQWHYPFENKEVFEKNFPGDFICEAIDQTRGWFYSLLVTSTFLHHAPAFKNVLVLGLICDKNGVKMSKSKNNVLDCMMLFNKYGADAVRWFLYSGTAPWNSRRFYEEGIQDVLNRFLGTIQNVQSFFTLYANIESFNPLNSQSSYESRNEIDRWIISRFHNTVKTVREALDAFEITRATQSLEIFVDDLSNWYLRRSRRRFWSSESSPDKTAAFLNLYELLVGTAKLIAPFTPFLSEQMYQNLVCSIDDTLPKSVHLTDFPTFNPSFIDCELENRMEFLRKVIQLGRSARNEANIKVRQPLSEIKVLVRDQSGQNVLTRMQKLIEEELNVKTVTPIFDTESLCRFVAKPKITSQNQKLIGSGRWRGS
ncbi:class I tRNA ligase family protein, partial [bacterium]|nr:class I tRNA ligase family protein [bacterium]